MKSVALFIALSAILQGQERMELPPLEQGWQQSKSIYGNDDRRDFYRADATYQAWAKATCALISAERLTQQDAYFHLLASPFKARIGNQWLPLCEEEPFSKQPVAAFCSAFLVAPDIVLTAGHCTGGSVIEVKKTCFVFGYQMVSSGKVALDFSFENVYRGAEILGFQLGKDGEGNHLDYAIVRLDRPVTYSKPLSIRSDEDALEQGEPIGVIGYPSGLPLKIAFGDAQVFKQYSKTQILTNLDAFGGNSGSAVLDSKGRIIGLLVSGKADFESRGACAAYRHYASERAGEWVTDIRAILPLLKEFLPSQQTFAEPDVLGSFFENGNGTHGDSTPESTPLDDFFEKGNTP